MTDLIIENIDPFTKGLLCNVRNKEGFKTLADALNHVMYEYYEKKDEV